MPDIISKQCAGARDAGNVISIKASLAAEVYLEAETGLYVSRCPALDLCSQGKTPKEAELNIIEAAGLFLEDCFERSVFGEVLEECGFRSIHPNSRRRKARKGPAIDPNIRQISIPVELPMMVYG